ncbi:MAG: PAS domain-containing protein [Bradyrhizobium sp.]
MILTLSDFYSELALHASTCDQPMLAHISRMAALEAKGKDIPVPLLGWNVLGIWDWDAASDVVYMGGKCAELFDVDPEAARRGLPISDFIKAMHPEDAPRVADTIMSALQNGGPYESRYRVIAKGAVRNVVAIGDCILDASGRAVRFPGVILELPGIVS